MFVTLLILIICIINSYLIFKLNKYIVEKEVKDFNLKDKKIHELEKELGFCKSSLDESIIQKTESDEMFDKQNEKIEKLENEPNIYEEDLEKEKKLNEKYCKDIKELEEKLYLSQSAMGDDAKNTMIRFEEIIDDKKDMITSLEDTVHGKEERIEELGKIIGDNEERIEELGKIIEDNEERIEEFENIVEEKQLVIEKLGCVNDENQEKIRKLYSRIGLKEKDSSITKVNVENKEIEDITKLLCPNCGKEMAITSTKRPINYRCNGCGHSGNLY